MLWVTGRVWPYVWQRSEAVEHAVLRQLLFLSKFSLTFFKSFQDPSYKEVQVGKDQEKAQSERDSHSKNPGGKKTN